ncbi:alpha/beta fold hydrolase [Denitrobaculum tricleocarpae]|uniref:Alpha/beta hydrolase n=1 Tax=Denitrobaculum tricleocarpae TaxID=2591009 RepID=A0A545TL01_9PROT|nr:alpha/beta hydrolase [Denitrobaculum tricleocarpae]TQV77899.1 alpha/beta hydrolase [Denitrobaculum tricleocarpae]
MVRPMTFAAFVSISVLGSAFAEEPVGLDPYAPYPLAQITDDIRYPAAQPPQGTVSRHGEIEYLAKNVFGTHWYISANDAVWHLVTAGDPDDETILFVHGHPDTWWSWHEVMALLADDFYVVAVDTLGYGQSDKRLELDLSYAGVAEGLEALMDRLGIGTFNLVGHDRGAVIGDHLVARESMGGRILAYLRMQQSADQPHGLPRPAHEEMASAEFHANENVIYGMFESDYYSVDMPQSHRDRAHWEYFFPGTAEAAAAQFSHAGFDKELEFRLAEVFPRMTMPVIFMQGAHDPGQRPEEYWRTAQVVPNGKVQIVDANHFIQAEKPKIVADAARDLFD